MQANVFISFLSLPFIPACVRVGPGWDDNYFPLLTHGDFRLQIREGKNHVVSLFLSLFFFFSITVCPAGLSWELWGQLVRQLLQWMLPLCISPGLRSPIEFSFDMWKFNQLPPLSALPFLPTHETVNIHLIGYKLVVFACLPPPKRARRCFSQTQES